jgi:lysine-specific demethylase 3
MTPSVSYTQMPSEKGKEKAADGSHILSFHLFLSNFTTIAPMRIVSDDATQSPGAETSVPLRPELQFARCMSNRYRSEQFPRCVSCTRRWAGDTCRFQGIRFFLKDSMRNLVGISFVETQKPDAPNMNFPDKWNVPLELSHIRRTKVRFW